MRMRISLLVVILSFTLSALGQFNSSKLMYLKGNDYFDQNKNILADSLYTASIDAELNSDACYKLALTKLRLGDTCYYCHNLKKASMLGDEISNDYYKQHCIDYSEKLTHFYKKNDTIFLLKTKVHPCANTYLDLAIAKAKLGEKCSFCNSIENPLLIGFPEIQTLFDKKCCSEKNIKITDSSQNGNSISNTILIASCSNKRKYTYIETNANKKTVLKYTTDKVSSGRILSITTNETRTDDNIEYKLLIDTTTLGSTEKEKLIEMKLLEKKPPPVLEFADTLPQIEIPEIMPYFPGGEEQLYVYLSKSIKMPMEAKETSINGVVMVAFIVEKDGSITGVSLLKDIGAGCGEEAVRVVKLMPKWNPGMKNGEKVRAKFVLPIRFTVSVY